MLQDPPPISSFETQILKDIHVEFLRFPEQSALKELLRLHSREIPSEYTLSPDAQFVL